MRNDRGGWGLAVALATAAWGGFPASCAAGPSKEASGVEALIRGLGSEEAAERDDARRRLLGLAEKDPERILRALPEGGDDPEVDVALAALRRSIALVLDRRDLMGIAGKDPLLREWAGILHEIRSLGVPNLPAEGIAAAERVAGLQRSPSWGRFVKDWEAGRKAEEYALILLRSELHLSPSETRPCEQRNGDIRCWALQALGAIRHPAAIPALAAELKRRDTLTAPIAATGLRSIKDPRVVEIFLDGLKEQGDQQIAGLCASGLISAGDETVCARVVPLLSSRHSPTRLGALMVLFSFRHRPASEGIAKALEDADPLVVLQAIAAVEGMGIAEAAPGLRKLLDEDLKLGGELKPRAAGALGALGDRKALPRLEALMAEDRSANRSYYALAIRKIVGEAKDEADRRRLAAVEEALGPKAALCGDDCAKAADASRRSPEKLAACRKCGMCFYDGVARPGWHSYGDDAK